MTTLRDLTESVLAAEADILGDEITYTPQSASPITFNAWVEFSTDKVGSSYSAATVYPKSIEVRASLIAEPTRADRITIAMRPGEIYAPADILEGETGQSWIIPLKKVAV